MKRNVDLTMNRDFQKTRNLRELSMFLRNRKFPWDIKSEYKNSENELIYTGNKKDRASSKRYELYMSCQKCECCGRNHSNTPWRMYNTICLECNNYLERDHLIQNDLILNSFKKRMYR